MLNPFCLIGISGEQAGATALHTLRYEITWLGRGPARTSVRDFFLRRIYTCEGEFYTLGRQHARQLIGSGIAIVDHNDLH